MRMDGLVRCAVCKNEAGGGIKGRLVAVGEGVSGWVGRFLVFVCVCLSVGGAEREMKTREANPPTDEEEQAKNQSAK
jgi:hypothetical protein